LLLRLALRLRLALLLLLLRCLCRWLLLLLLLLALLLLGLVEYFDMLEYLGQGRMNRFQVRNGQAELLFDRSSFLAILKLAQDTVARSKVCAAAYFILCCEKIPLYGLGKLEQKPHDRRELGFNCNVILR
jgi:hypothetical protein